MESDTENKPTTTKEAMNSEHKLKNQGKKRKRCSSESSNENEMILPDNALETERNVHASAMKNNLDETSVRKIIKKVVTNDHVLALVKLREEEENSCISEKNIIPKLTRAKVKELKKVSPQSAAWNMQNLELTPIKHIPVKTRPEVKALIAQELPEDEDDEEYEPANDEVPSDDDHIESSSDLDSQPRTPATPASNHADSPRVVLDGPFKVPQEVSSARRKLQIDEEAATIALRTRSKLSLSSTSIEHIESTFVPPDDLPMPDVDGLWSQFLDECLNPASTSRNEEDDEADPEYNAAADADAHDEDEESLGRSLIKISKKELNDLVTELFNIIPETEETEHTQNMSNSVLTNNSQSEIKQRDVKQEPLSDEENGEQPSKKLTFEKSSYSRVSMGKNETENDHESQCNVQCGENVYSKGVSKEIKESPKIATPMLRIRTKNRNIEISIEERNPVQPSFLEEAPPSLRNKIKPVTETVCIKVDSSAVTMTPEQVLILQQQLRQHIQLSTSNFLQLFVHPVHWKLAPTYKDYLTSLTNIVEKNDKSVVNVCNLQPAHELVTTWEASVSEDTEENRKMIEFVQSEVARSRRRMASNCLYAGNFHETFKNVICNSPVFLYPYLLPSMPYRPDVIRRYSYLHSEDTLIVLGMDQFWSYVDSNPQLFKLRTLNPRIRRGLSNTMELVAKHMFPWMNPRTLSGHVQAVRSQGDEHNPIYRYFKYNEMPKIEHRILPFNPSISLYEQPEHEMPKIWVRYLAKTSKRFRNYIYKRHNITGRPPEGVPINPGITPDATVRKPLPIDFTKQIVSHRATLHTKPHPTELTNRLDIDVQTPDQNNAKDSTQSHTLVAQNFFKLVETSTGAFLVPLQVNTQTVNSNIGPITTPAEVSSTIIANNLPETRPKRPTHKDHCSCCVLLRSICKEKQMLITHYFKSKSLVKKCDCSNIKFPKVSNKLRLLVRNHKKASELVFKELERILKNGGRDETTEIQDCDIKDMMYVLSYQLKLFSRASMSKRISVKQRVNSLLSRFEVEYGDPVTLAKSLFKTFDVELVDLYLDFLPFLTPDQADTVDMFKDYFTRNCSKDLMDKVTEQVHDKEVRLKILTQLKSVFSDGKSSSCDICSGLLETMAEYPILARYTFNLFPHRKENRTQVCDTVETGSCTQVQGDKDANDTEYEEPHNTVDYEADQSSFGEDSDAMSVDLEEPLVEESQDFDTPLKMENLAEDPLEDSEATITKTEAEEFDTSISVFISENIKSEQEMSEWKREDDKIVLELLKEYLSPDERQGKTIQENLELLEEKNVYELLSSGLTDKSLSEIKERVLVLLSVVLSVDTVCTK